MTASKPVVLVALLVACDHSPTAPVPDLPGLRGAAAEVSDDREGIALSLTVPGQLVSIEFGDGSTARAWVSAQLTAGTENAPIGDGAILVVSAADGPMPQSDPTAESFSIRIESAAVDAGGVVSFEGMATSSEGRRDRRLGWSSYAVRSRLTVRSEVARSSRSTPSSRSRSAS